MTLYAQGPLFLEDNFHRIKATSSESKCGRDHDLAELGGTCGNWEVVLKIKLKMMKSVFWLLTGKF